MINTPQPNVHRICFSFFIPLYSFPLFNPFIYSLNLFPFCPFPMIFPISPVLFCFRSGFVPGLHCRIYLSHHGNAGCGSSLPCWQVGFLNNKLSFNSFKYHRGLFCRDRGIKSLKEISPTFVGL